MVVIDRTAFIDVPNREDLLRGLKVVSVSSEHDGSV